MPDLVCAVRDAYLDKVLHETGPMTADPHQNRTALRRFARWLALPLVLALLVFVQSGLRGHSFDAAQDHPEIAGYAGLHLAAIKPAKPELRLRTFDALPPTDGAFSAFIPRASALAIPAPAQPHSLRLHTGRHARAPPHLAA